MKNKLIISLSLISGSLALNALALELTPSQIQKVQDLIANNPDKFKNLKTDFDSYNSTLETRSKTTSPILRKALELSIAKKVNLIQDALAKA